MGNHTVECGVCGEDLRGLTGGCASGCPGTNVDIEIKIKYWQENGMMDYYWVESQLPPKYRKVQPRAIKGAVEQANTETKALNRVLEKNNKIDENDDIKYFAKKLTMVDKNWHEFEWFNNLSTVERAEILMALNMLLKIRSTIGNKK